MGKRFNYVNTPEAGPGALAAARPACPGGGRLACPGGGRLACWPGRRYPDCYAFARGGLDIEPRPSLLRLAHVQHLATAVSGLLAREVSALALAAVLLHPTAAGAIPARAGRPGRLRLVAGAGHGRSAAGRP